ncbi:MAG TPA: hypothetical protein VFB58_05070 [Chloroflexota bacterium]|nr:hypothetical protein [Chloroflexota bacterium]
MHDTRPEPRYTVLLTCSTTARLPEGTAFTVERFPVSTTPVDVQFCTRYEDIGMEAPLPRELYAETSVTGGDFQDAIAASEQAANVLTPLMSLASNAFVPEFQLQLAYETTPGAARRQFKQWFYGDPVPVLPLLPGRLLDPDLTWVVVGHVLQHPEGERIHRACVQYQEALRSWLPQRELRAVAHLFMAVEALTKALLRQECEQRSIDADGLCAEWGIEKKELDGEIRRRLIFHGDRQCYKTMKDVSDGLEHGFLAFPKLHDMAARCRDTGGRHIREAILQFLHLPSDAYERLVSATYERPVSGHGVIRAIEGVFVGEGVLAAPGAAHPFFEWTVPIKAVERRGTDHVITMQDNATLHCADGIQFTATGHGANVPIPDATVDVVRGKTNLSSSDEEATHRVDTSGS